MVSLNTVRTHTKHIYTKLGVNNRAPPSAGPTSWACWAAPRLKITTSVTTCCDDRSPRPLLASPAMSTRTAAGDADWYEIHLQGRLDPRWATWFDGMTVTTDADGTTLIRGPVADQAALHGLLARLRDLGLPLLSVTQVTRRPA